MREAIGSTFLFKIMIVFIFFFTAFLAIAINYSQAFKTKNQIINIIEQSEGINTTSKEKIINYAIDISYYRDVRCNCDDISCDGETGQNLRGIKLEHNGKKIDGVCVRRHNPNSSSNSAYYTVTTFVHFKFPIIGDLLTIPVTGETKLIVNNNET